MPSPRATSTIDAMVVTHINNTRYFLPFLKTSPFSPNNDRYAKMSSTKCHFLELSSTAHPFITPAPKNKDLASLDYATSRAIWEKLPGRYAMVRDQTNETLGTHKKPGAIWSYIPRSDCRNYGTCEIKERMPTDPRYQSELLQTITLSPRGEVCRKFLGSTSCSHHAQHANHPSR